MGPRSIETGATEPQARTEVDRRKPFSIRGHHLSAFCKLDELLRKTLEQDPWFVSFVPGAMAESDIQAVDLSLKQISEGKSNGLSEEYCVDVQGNTEQQKRMRKNKLTKVYRTFCRIPDDYPVEIVSGRKDEICKACVFGKHCSVTENKYTIYDSTRLERDTKFVFRFESRAQELGLRQDMKFVILQSAFSDSKNIPVLGLRTTAGTVRKVLQNSSANDWI